jgi:hypothetical protein
MDGRQPQAQNVFRPYIVLEATYVAKCTHGFANSKKKNEINNK